MSKILWKSLLLSPAILGAALAVSSSAMAGTNPATAEALQPEAATTKAPLLAQLTETTVPASTATPSTQTPVPTSVDALSEVERYGNEGKQNQQAQVTSVSQLSDVQPTDWAFQALQSLVERYGVIAGYPDGTYRGNRAMTRYEFAAGLNAALDRVNELIAAGTADAVRKEDLATLQRLQEEFAAELATLRGRVDALEAQTAELEANQFSTTTKLVGEVVAAVTDTFGDNDENNTVFQERVRLDLQTSFFGSDILHTRIATGNAASFDKPGSPVPQDLDGDGIANDTASTLEGTQTFNVTPSTENDVYIDWAAYQFPLFGESQAYIGVAGGIWSDFVPTVNPYFEDYDGGRGALSTFAQENSIYRIGGGSGVGLNLALGERGILGVSSLTLGYLADQAADPGDNTGLFNGDYAALGQLNINLGDRLGIAATYVHGYHNAGNGIYDIGGSRLATDDPNTEEFDPAVNPIIGTALANDPSLLLPTSVPIVTNSYGVAAAFRLSDAISLSAFGTYTDAILIGEGDADIWSFGGGVAFPDFGKRGNLLGIFAGVEPTLTGLEAENAADFSNRYPLHVEGFYRYQLTDNISITPGVIWLDSPGQNEDNEDVFIGTLRTTFNF